MNLKRINVFTGWAVFLIASIVYLATIPPTTSFWDCGEFISTASKIEVSHSPGAPFFMILARIFTLFSPTPAHTAMMVNAMSAIASAFTIMFLFWTITHLAEKILLKNDESSEEKLSDGGKLAIIGAGLVGAFAYMFTDTFWYSAVEGEVYALSSLFTAVVFWSILKWENDADKPFANRWLVLIAYLIGLSIGVHLLNLLAIPAIVFVYYFKKYPTSFKGIIVAVLTSLILLGAIMYVIIPYTIKIAGYFDRLFVNSLGLPFNSGVLFFGLILALAIVYGLYYTSKHKKIIANTILLCVTVILIGYSSYAITVIRSNANPPMDQNNPEDLFSLLSYLNREQYGDRPLVKGQYYSAPVVNSTNKYSYRKKGDSYEKFINGYIYQYDKRFTTFFPRMYDSDASHVREYERWGHIEGKPISVSANDRRVLPTFGENIRYFLSYQLGFMYGRYFMWNFVGRQNDVQGHGEAANGNWYSGIPFIDNARLGDQSDLPNHLANVPGRNSYYFLPLLLGLIGLLYQYGKHKKDFWVVMMLFVLTGIAIVVYLNQYPLQPRERDYAYAGSFYAFAIWIGIGMLAIFELLNKKINSKVSAITASIVCLVAVPGVLGSENWDDHDRSGRYTAQDFAYNYLNSCEKDAILFTNGDNDTFPIWYLQEVEEERTDVRIICLPYLSTDWYINQMKRQSYKSKPVPFSMGYDKYRQGTRDMIFVNNRPDLFINERYKANRKQFQTSFDKLLSNLVVVLNDGLFAKQEPSTWNKLLKKNLTPVQLASFIKKLASKDLVEKYKLSTVKMSMLQNQSEGFIADLGKSPMPLKLAMDFVANDGKHTRMPGFDGSPADYLPAKKFVIPIDKKAIIEKGVVQPEDTALIVDRVVFSVKGRYLVKSDMMILDLLANNNWERPIYFTSVGTGALADLQKYTQLEGFAYRIVPIKNNNDYQVHINSRLLYDRFFNKFMFRNLNNKDIYQDWTNVRTLSVVSFRRKMGALATTYIKEGNYPKAIVTIDKALDILPLECSPLDFMEVGFIGSYFKAGAPKKGRELAKKVFRHTFNELKFYLTDNERIDVGYKQSQQMAIAVMQTVMDELEPYNERELLDSFRDELKVLLSEKSNITSQINKYTPRQRNLIGIFFSLQKKDLQKWFQSLPKDDKGFISKLNSVSHQDIKILQLYMNWIGV